MRAHRLKAIGWLQIFFFLNLCALHSLAENDNGTTVENSQLTAFKILAIESVREPNPNLDQSCFSNKRNLAEVKLYRLMTTRQKQIAQFEDFYRTTAIQILKSETPTLIIGSNTALLCQRIKKNGHCSTGVYIDDCNDLNEIEESMKKNSEKSRIDHRQPTKINFFLQNVISGMEI